MLIYGVIPTLARLIKKFDPMVTNKVCLTLGAVFALDCILYQILN